jgi:hypothetical protein
MANRPKTMREMQADKAAKQQLSVATITVTNISKQLIKVHLNAPKGVDFYVGAQDISLTPGQTFTFKKNRVRLDQITNLRKQRKLSLVSETIEEEDTAAKTVRKI